MNSQFLKQLLFHLSQKGLFCKHEQNVQFSRRRYKISLGLDMDSCEEHICRNYRIFPGLLYRLFEFWRLRDWDLQKRDREECSFHWRAWPGRSLPLVSAALTSAAAFSTWRACSSLSSRALPSFERTSNVRFSRSARRRSELELQVKIICSFISLSMLLNSQVLASWRSRVW